MITSLIIIIVLAVGIICICITLATPRALRTDSFENASNSQPHVAHDSFVLETSRRALLRSISKNHMIMSPARVRDSFSLIKNKCISFFCKETSRGGSVWAETPMFYSTARPVGHDSFAGETSRGPAVCRHYPVSWPRANTARQTNSSPLFSPANAVCGRCHLILLLSQHWRAGHKASHFFRRPL